MTSFLMISLASSLTSLETAVTVIGALIALGTLMTIAVRSGRAYRILGRVEKTFEIYGDRLQNHSDTLKDHEAILLRLEMLPETVSCIKKDMGEMKTNIAVLLSKLDSYEYRS